MLNDAGPAEDKVPLRPTEHGTAGTAETMGSAQLAARRSETERISKGNQGVPKHQQLKLMLFKNLKLVFTNVFTLNFQPLVRL